MSENLFSCPLDTVQPSIIEEDSDAVDVKEYGIGVDCHKKFIIVCVRTRHGSQFQSTVARFNTDWNSLVRAKDWSLEILDKKSEALQAY